MQFSAKPLFISSFILISLPTAVWADACQERFKSLLINGNGEGPVKILATQKIKGGMESKNYFYQLSFDHWMTQMLEPAGQSWVLTYNNVMFTSSDEGKSWKKLRSLDSGNNREKSIQSLTENAKTTRNAACGTEELEGVSYEVIEAEYSAVVGYKSENHHKYWVHPETGFIAKATYHMKAENFESNTTQLIEKAPDLELPTPQ